MEYIKGSVGRGGMNFPDDVKKVQRLLNQSPVIKEKLLVDGKYGPKTFQAIIHFQLSIFPSKNFCDGRVDRLGKTLQVLNKAQTVHSKRLITPSTARSHSQAMGGHIGMMSTNEASIGRMNLSNAALNLLKSIESARLKPYDDQTGKEISTWCQGATIGYGHLISKAEWKNYAQGITEENATTLFSSDLKQFIRAVNSKVSVVLTQHQFDALVIFAFNIGTGGFATSSVLKLVNDPTAITGYQDLESAWLAWNKSQGVVSDGLTKRRKVEWNIYSQNTYKRW